MYKYDFSITLPTLTSEATLTYPSLKAHEHSACYYKQNSCQIDNLLTNQLLIFLLPNISLCFDCYEGHMPQTLSHMT